MAKKKQKKQKKEHNKKVESQVKEVTRIEKLRDVYYIAKIKDQFEISKAIDFDTHYNWLWYMYGIVNDEAYKLILGYIKDKKIVLFTGEEKGRIDRSILGVEDVMKLRKICKNKFGLGNYKIYNGIKYNEEKNRYDALGTIIDFDIRQDEK